MPAACHAAPALGDRITIDRAAPVKRGDYVVAKRDHDEQPVFRRHEPRGHDKYGREIIDLVPLNPDYPTLRIDGTNPGRILGRVIKRARRF